MEPQMYCHYNMLRGEGKHFRLTKWSVFIVLIEKCVTYLSFYNIKNDVLAEISNKQMAWYELKILLCETSVRVSWKSNRFSSNIGTCSVWRPNLFIITTSIWNPMFAEILTHIPPLVHNFFTILSYGVKRTWLSHSLYTNVSNSVHYGKIIIIFVCKM